MQTTPEELYDIFLNHRNISTDSRRIAPDCLFFALKGDNFDGNVYAGGAVESGAAYAVIDDKKFEGKQTLLVDDVLGSLQHLARMHRRKYKFPVLAITGSNGKTTTKELVNEVLSRQYHVTATKGNLNNHIGVPLTLLGITDETELAIIEMGANHQGEIAQLCSIAEPTHGLITNIGKAHIEGFGGYEGVIKGKSELYKWLLATSGEVFVNADNPLLTDLSTGIRRILYGKQEDNFTSGEFIENSEMLAIKWETGSGKTTIETNLVGSYNFENVMAAICIGTYFKVPPAKIKSAICSYLPSNSRSQAMKTAKNSIILDAYNANPTSMQAAIENFRHMKAKPKMVILGDMLELGDESLAEHLSIVRMIEESDFESVILIGPDFMQVAGKRFTSFRTADEAYIWLKSENIQDFNILVKGSRGIKMEKVLDAL